MRPPHFWHWAPSSWLLASLAPCLVLLFLAVPQHRGHPYLQHQLSSRVGGVTQQQNKGFVKNLIERGAAFASVELFWSYSRINETKT